MSAPAANPGHKRRILLLATMGVLAGLAIVAAIVAARFQPVARDYFIATLRKRYQSDVVLDSLQISLYPAVHAKGENLVLWFHGDHTMPPMVRIRRFRLDANFVNFFRTPKHIGTLRLEGLELHPPPRTAATSPPGARQESQSTDPAVAFILDEVIADGTTLEIAPKDPKKQPLIFDIRKLSLHTIGKGQPMTFHAEFINPKPHGVVQSDGRFGPWNTATPVETPLSGAYTFRDADLSDFHGIAGTLSSDGKFDGPLDRLEVEGKTDVPNFALTTGAHPMSLHTDFEATVDGTNGNTILHPVRARLGQSAFDVSGTIERGALETHKAIRLDARSGSSARLEDFLRLALKGPRIPMTGALQFNTKVEVPPGPRNVIDRLELDGNFALKSVRFSSIDVQSKIAALSHRAQGDPDNHDPDVSADFNGDFHLFEGKLGLPNLHFTVPGADIELAGTYTLPSGAIDFHGTAKLQATASQMTTGSVSKFLKYIDPFFSRDGAGTVVPITIGGTRGQPSFHLDVGQLFRRN